MIHMPGGPFWSVMFFSMLINLGLGSMFGTLEGIITPLRDIGLNIKKEAIVGRLSRCVKIDCNERKVDKKSFNHLEEKYVKKNVKT